MDIIYHECKGHILLSEKIPADVAILHALLGASFKIDWMLFGLNLTAIIFTASSRSALRDCLYVFLSSMAPKHRR